MTGPVTKTCERCRQTFECGGYRCWCGQVEITEAHMDWIEVRFRDCLCPACLHLVRTGQEGPRCAGGDQS